MYLTNAWTRQLKHVCRCIHVTIWQRVFVKMSSAFSSSAGITYSMVREGLLIPFTLRRCYLSAHLQHLHDSVVMIPVASRGQELPETRHFSLAESFKDIWDNEIWSSLKLFHMTEWEYKDSDNGRKWFHLYYNATKWISYQTVFIFHFLRVQFIISKKQNCLTSKCETKSK